MKFSNDVEKFIEALKEMQDGQSVIIKAKVDEILKLSNTAHRLKLFHRFLDRNQPPLNDDVLPDVSFPQNPPLNSCRYRGFLR